MPRKDGETLRLRSGQAMGHPRDPSTSPLATLGASAKTGQAMGHPAFFLSQIGRAPQLYFLADD
jgi:hypothetical protein